MSQLLALMGTQLALALGSGGFSVGAVAAESAPSTNLPPGHVRGLPPSISPGKDRSRVTDADREWWSFQPLRWVRPVVRAEGAVRNPIDRFVLARLEAKQLKLSPPADRRTLIRRASFDLLGLPPTPEEVEAFERDPSPDAWPRLLRRLLDSPRHGERWARHWLDVARFAESSGFEHDYDRPSAYHYRDFVIRAFNSDLPYDQFVRWQLAGDEFEPDNPLALMATGFLGAGVFPTQITANEVERTRYDAMDDMLSTAGTAMLGLTIGCARCHDHKYDPIPTHDYYRMLATFTSTVRSEVELDLQPDENRRAREAYEREHAPLVGALEEFESKELPERFDRWLKSGAALPAPPQWALLEPSAIKSEAGATFRKLEDGSFLAEGKNGDRDVYTFVADVRGTGWRALRLEALAHASLPRKGPGRAENGNIGLSRIRVFSSPIAGGPTNEIRLARARATFEQNKDHLSISAALDEKPGSGWAVDPQFGTNHAAIFEFEQAIGSAEGLRLEVRLEFSVNTRHNIGRPRLSVTSAEQPAFNEAAVPSAIAELLKRAQEGSRAFSTADRGALLAWWKTSEPGWRALQAKVEAHARVAPKPKLTKVLICAEGHPAVRMHTQGADFFKETYFLQRGSTDQKKGVAAPGFLQALLRGPELEPRWRVDPPVGAKFSGRRRALAQWLTDPEKGAGHLLARVMVNRLWQHHFGQGLVTTPNDFGVQGSAPTHPELLDWLASELIRGGWRLKPIHQLMMSSAVYQQGALPNATREKVMKADPDNALLSRRVPLRLEAETIRDSLLFVAGLLETNLYGPGTLNEASRRRSIYFTIKRSQLVPAMQAFDAPEPLVSQGVRPSTTVAPQALILMNSPHVRSWAAAFAARWARPGQDTAAAVDRAYALALNRKPSRQERAQALRFIAEQEGRHQSDPADPTDRTDRSPRGRARTDFAQVLLSLNEFIYAE